MNTMLLAPDPAYLLAALGAVAVLIGVLVVADFGHSCRKFRSSAPKKGLILRWVKAEQPAPQTAERPVSAPQVKEQPVPAPQVKEQPVPAPQTAEQEAAISLAPPAALAIRPPAEVAVKPPAAVAARPSAEVATRPPAALAVLRERHDFAAEHRVSAADAAEMMADEEAEEQVVRSGRLADKTRTAIVNIDTLSDYFEDGDYVDIDAMKARIPFFDKRATYVKVLARGFLTKTLEVEADVYSMEAAKMILLLGGKVIVTRKE